jgi:hypothetical protein
MELTKVILDFIAKIAWPAAVLTISFLFRSEIRSIFGRVVDSSRVAVKVAGQEFVMERELKQQVVKELIIPPVSKESRSEIAAQIVDRVDAMIPFLESRLDTDNLIMVNQLRNSGGTLDRSELFRLSRAAGVHAGLGGKLTALRSARVVSESADRVSLTELGREVAEWAAHYLEERNIGIA